MRERQGWVLRLTANLKERVDPGSSNHSGFHSRSACRGIPSGDSPFAGIDDLQKSNHSQDRQRMLVGKASEAELSESL